MKFIIKLVLLVLLLNIITFKANAKATLSYDDIVGSDVVTGIIAKDTANFQMGS
ncbi:hypothetical protein [Caloramator sp. Dgby_cultured_2]|uniref:hypothetical protein n=1 Tax=Caloramator sp. Dgby_cultured_2 TaxID=3029174 RepID=UPI00237E4297|nr:hypothetical protein [Caloramator sp. Dgby_cultured_2]WDU83308.1 hypothetical protein PWK10_00815 [Caloramator sp. Dgby_cultured_2]